MSKTIFLNGEDRLLEHPVLSINSKQVNQVDWSPTLAIGAELGRLFGEIMVGALNPGEMKVKAGLSEKDDKLSYGKFVSLKE